MEFANQIGLEMVDILLGISPISQCAYLCECVCTSLNAVGFLSLHSVAININVGSKRFSLRQTLMIHLLRSLFDLTAASKRTIDPKQLWFSYQYLHRLLVNYHIIS